MKAGTGSEVPPQADTAQQKPGKRLTTPTTAQPAPSPKTTQGGSNTETNSLGGLQQPGGSLLTWPASNGTAPIQSEQRKSKPQHNGHSAQAAPPSAQTSYLSFARLLDTLPAWLVDSVHPKRADGAHEGFAGGAYMLVIAVAIAQIAAGLSSLPQVLLVADRSMWAGGLPLGAQTFVLVVFCFAAGVMVADWESPLKRNLGALFACIGAWYGRELTRLAFGGDPYVNALLGIPLIALVPVLLVLVAKRFDVTPTWWPRRLSLPHVWGWLTLAAAVAGVLFCVFGLWLPWLAVTALACVALALVAGRRMLPRVVLLSAAPIVTMSLVFLTHTPNPGVYTTLTGFALSCLCLLPAWAVARAWRLGSGARLLC